MNYNPAIYRKYTYMQLIHSNLPVKKIFKYFSKIRIDNIPSYVILYNQIIRLLINSSGRWIYMLFDSIQVGNITLKNR